MKVKEGAIVIFYFLVNLIKRSKNLKYNRETQ